MLSLAGRWGAVVGRGLSGGSRARVKIHGIPVLLYHGIVPGSDSVRGLSSRARRYLLSAADFHRQLDVLQHSAVRTCSLCDIRTCQVEEVGGAAVAISFDDGRRSDFIFAYPALAARGMTGEFFVTTNEIGKPGFLDWPEILEMCQAEMSFQSHGTDHVDLRRLGVRDLRNQLEISKHTLEDRLGTAVSFLAVPYGLLNHRILDTARAVGYSAVCSSVRWPAVPGSSLMGRIAIHWGDDVRTFRRIMEKDWRFYLSTRLQEVLLSPVKSVARRFIPGRLGISHLRSNGGS